MCSAVDDFYFAIHCVTPVILGAPQLSKQYPDLQNWSWVYDQNKGMLVMPVRVTNQVEIMGSQVHLLADTVLKLQKGAGS